jgi:hypothetical protein
VGLYLVRIELEMVVEATGSQHAVRVAREHSDEAAKDLAHGNVEVGSIKTLSQLPMAWNNCYPWGTPSVATCSELLKKPV